MGDDEKELIADQLRRGVPPREVMDGARARRAADIHGCCSGCDATGHCTHGMAPMTDQRHSGESRVTHGRHCPCSACAREDWTNPRLAHCGEHGPDCPREYAPVQRHPGEPETPQTDPLLQAWREWTMQRATISAPQWEGLQLVREAFVAGWEAAALATPGVGLDVGDLRTRVRALQPRRRTLAYRQGYDDAVMAVLNILRDLGK